ncbi:MAG: nitrate reductase cytochrome c-type subunit [Alphaproteobacteria bacterium]|nr:nitrate reductase cytochrome c-type subunit [Alphaproteobacteria bacterium]
MKNGFSYLAAILAGLALAAAIPVMAEEIKSLRGANGVAGTSKAPQLHKPSTASRFPRTFRTQPPLIPHSVDKHQINLKANRCIACHDRAVHVEQQAPAISRSHYIRRDGSEGISISKTRYFCTQCHVPQLNAPPLVGNTFKGVK